MNAGRFPCHHGALSDRLLAGREDPSDGSSGHPDLCGDGLKYANACGFAPKPMETGYVVAERFSSADFLHGSIAMVEPNFPVFLFAPSGPTWVSMRETIATLRDLKAETAAITDRRNPPGGSCSRRHWRWKEL